MFEEAEKFAKRDAFDPWSPFATSERQNKPERTASAS
jgi:hypothetical protein